MSNTNSASAVSMALLQSKLMCYIPDGSQYPLSNTIGLFLEILDEPTWNDMKAGINAFINESTGDLYPFLRVLVTLADGTVAYESHSLFNTYLAFSKKDPRVIEHNQNHRLSNLTALMSNAGTGYEKKYSSIHQQDRLFYATRMGSSAQHALGVVRVAVNDNSRDRSRDECGDWCPKETPSNEPPRELTQEEQDELGRLCDMLSDTGMG